MEQNLPGELRFIFRGLRLKVFPQDSHTLSTQTGLVLVMPISLLPHLAEHVFVLWSFGLKTLPHIGHTFFSRRPFCHFVIPACKQSCLTLSLVIPSLLAASVAVSQSSAISKSC